MSSCWGHIIPMCAPGGGPTLAEPGVLTPSKAKEVRDVITQDIVALQRWSQIVDSLVEPPAERLRIGKLLEKSKYHQAVMVTLECWMAQVGKDATFKALVAVMERHGLKSLAENLVALLNVTPGCLQSTTGVWFDVGEVPHNFTGRDTGLIRLEEIILRRANSGARSGPQNWLFLITAIVGMGGVGKSTLATKFAWSNWKVFDKNVLWIEAETLTKMRSSFHRVAKRVGVGAGDHQSNSDLADAVYSAFSRGKPPLLIFDNVEDFADLRQFLPKLQPGSTKPYILITTRRVGVTLPDRTLLLEVWELDEAIKFVNLEIPYANLSDAKSLAEKLQKLPLAMQQAVAYINDEFDTDTKSPISKYLTKFDKETETLLADTRFQEKNTYSMTTMTTWMITMDRIRGDKDKQRGANTLELIKVLAYLNPDQIRPEFLQKVVDYDPGPCTSLLKKFSMITVGECIRIHRLVQEVTRLRLELPEQETIIRSITDSWKQIKSSNSVTRITLLEKVYSTHGHAIFSVLLRNSVLMQRFQVWINNFCCHLTAYGKYEESLDIARKCAERFQKDLGSTHEYTLAFRSLVASVLHDLEKYKDSEAIFEEIIPLMLLWSGDAHHETLGALSEFAGLKSKTGNMQKALEVCEEVIESQELELGKLHQNTLVSLSRKGRMLMTMGRLSEALEFCRETHEQCVRSLGVRDETTMDVHLDIARVLRLQGKRSESLDELRQLLIHCVGVLGNDNPLTIVVRSDIALTEKELNNEKKKHAR